MQLILPVLLAGTIFRMYRKKLIPAAWLLVLLLCGAGASAMAVREFLAGAETQVTSLERDAASEGSVTVPLEVRAGEKRYEIGMEVPGHLRTKEERQRVLEETAASLDGMILGKNDSPDHVVWDLCLPTSFEESPVTASWNSDHPEWLNWDGTLGGSIPAEGGAVTVKGTLFLEGECLDIQRTLILFPSEEDAAFAQRLQKSAEELNAGKEEQRWKLPEEEAGRPLLWYRKNDTAGTLLCLLLLLVSALLPQTSKKREEERRKKRLQDLGHQYPGFVSSLHLYLCAGLSMRRSVERMARTVRKKEQEQRRGKAIDEEIAHVWAEMENGVSEQDVWLHFGERCVLSSYRTLALLLIQNRVHGGAGLSALLEREARAAFETRKRQARAEGEKASVRLILPMGMMLVVVMALIMVPALMNL